MAALGTILACFLAGDLLAETPTSAHADTAVVAVAPEQRGDAAFAARSDTLKTDGAIDPASITAAIEAYEAALAAAPDDLRLHFKLMEALYFKGTFVVAETRDRKPLYARSIELTRHAMGVLAARTGVADLADRPLEEQAHLLREKPVPEAAEAHFWAGINWGLWGMTFGYLASAGEGVAGRIRDHATLVTLIDPAFADAGGRRLLGRLHALTPRIPFVTGWIDRARAIELLEQAHATSTRDPRNAFFLAEALLEFAPDRRAEALTLLREAAAHTPDPTHRVEQLETIHAAATRLAAEEKRDASGR